MGLDISACSKLVEAPNAERDEDGYPADYESFNKFYDNKDFPGRFEGLNADMIYGYSADSDFDHFSIGYGRYNAWREELARLAGYGAEEYERYGRKDLSHCVPCWNGAQGPFAEQINFSDCEGTIGPIVCAKLAKDYAEFSEKAEAVGGYFWDKYQEFKRCFDIGADGGAVKFH